MSTRQQEDPAMPHPAAVKADSFLADREAWVAAGRPADRAFAHWARCEDAPAPSAPAIGVRVGDRYVTVEAS